MARRKNTNPAPETVDHVDDAAFMDALVRQYCQNMYVTARRYLDAADAEDAVQDAFLKLLPKLPLLRELDQRRLRSYVLTTARNTAISGARRRKTEQAHCAPVPPERAAEYTAADAEAPEDQVLGRERARAFAEAIRQLGDTEQFLLDAKYTLELSGAQIAEQLGVQPDSVRMMLTRARRSVMNLLRSEVDADGSDS